MGFIQLPNYRVASYTTFSLFPAVGEKGVWYLDETLADGYLWTGAIYEAQGGGGGGGAWGSITGTLTDQTDLADYYGRNTILGSTVTISTKTTVFTNAVAANTKYSFEYTIYYFSDGISNFGMWPTYPAGCVLTYSQTLSPASSGYQPAEVDANVYTTGSDAGNNTASYQLFKLWLDVETGSTAGNVVLRLTNNSGTYGEARKGSHMRARIVT